MVWDNLYIVQSPSRTYYVKISDITRFTLFFLFFFSSLLDSLTKKASLLWSALGNWYLYNFYGKVEPRNVTEYYPILKLRASLKKFNVNITWSFILLFSFYIATVLLRKWYQSADQIYVVITIKLTHWTYKTVSGC